MSNNEQSGFIGVTLIKKVFYCSMRNSLKSGIPLSFGFNVQRIYFWILYDHKKKRKVEFVSKKCTTFYSGYYKTFWKCSRFSSKGRLTKTVSNTLSTYDTRYVKYVFSFPLGNLFKNYFSINNYTYYILIFSVLQ